MLKIQEAFAHLSHEEYKSLLDIPVWLTLLAAYTANGKLTVNEKNEAIKLSHLRRFTAPKSIRALYVKLSQIFPERVKVLNSRLPEDEADKILYIKAQVRSGHAVFEKLDPDIAESLSESLSSFYKHIFNCDKGFFHYFALPVISSHVEKDYSGHLHHAFH